MQTIPIEEAQANLADLIAKVTSGEDIAISQQGVPTARLTSIAAQAPVIKRRLGFLANKGYIVPEQFDRIGDQEIEDSFENSL